MQRFLFFLQNQLLENGFTTSTMMGENNLTDYSLAVLVDRITPVNRVIIFSSGVLPGDSQVAACVWSFDG